MNFIANRKTVVKTHPPRWLLARFLERSVTEVKRKTRRGWFKRTFDYGSRCRLSTRKRGVFPGFCGTDDNGEYRTASNKRRAWTPVNLSPKFSRLSLLITANWITRRKTSGYTEDDDIWPTPTTADGNIKSRSSSCRVSSRAVAHARHWEIRYRRLYGERKEMEKRRGKKAEANGSDKLYPLHKLFSSLDLLWNFTSKHIDIWSFNHIVFELS